MEPFAMRHFPFLLALGLAAAIPAGATAATWVWPDHSGSGPCAASLQACLAGVAAGDTVLIGPDEPSSPDAYTAIDEGLVIQRSLTLGTLPGIDAVLAPDRMITVWPTGPGPHVVTITGLVLRRGAVYVRDEATAPGSRYAIERLRILEAIDPNLSTCAIEARLGSPASEITIADNRIDTGGPAGSPLFRYGICVGDLAGAGTLTARILRNRIRAGAALTEQGIALGLAHASGDLRVLGNEVRGPNVRYGIYAVFDPPGPTRSLALRNNVVAFADDAFADGIRIDAPGAGTSIAVTNNTVVHGQGGIGALAATGRVANNLIAHHAGRGLWTSAAIVNAHNLFHANAGGNTTGPAPGPGSVLADPQLESQAYPRPRPGSPAIDAGSNTDVPLGSFDADGERRIVGAAVDIGAHEASSDAAAVVEATAANTSGNWMRVAPFPVPLAPSDRLVANAIRTTPALAGSAQHLGVFLAESPAGWAIFHQDTGVPVAPGQRFAVLAPVDGTAGLVHVSSAASVAGNRTRLDDPALNALPDAIAIAFHRWQPTLYHDRPIGLHYTASRWHVRNEDGAAMPTGLHVHVAAAPLGSPNAFRTTLGPAPAPAWRLDHPLLDDNDCAAPIVGRADDPDVAGETPNPTRMSLAYRPPSGPGAPGRWFVVAQGTGTPVFPAQSAFHVLVHGPQASRCRAPRVDPLFVNGFE